MSLKRTQNLSSGPLSPFILREIENLRRDPQTIDKRARISRLEKIAERARNLEALGEQILSAVKIDTERRTTQRPGKIRSAA